MSRPREDAKGRPFSTPLFLTPRFTRRRRTLIYAQLGLTCAFLVGTGVVVNVIAREHGRRWNWTKDRIEELAPDTVQRLRGIDREIQLLLNPMEIGQIQDRALPEAWRLIREMLREFERLNPRIKVSVMDETQAPPPWVQEFGPQLQPNSLYLYDRGADGRSNKRIFQVRELYSGNPQTGEIEDFQAEPRLISALWTMLHNRKKTVYYTVGHDENRIEDRREQGMSILLQGLHDYDNVQWKPLDLDIERQVPRDADAVFIPGARRDFAAHHVDTVAEYLTAGGRLFVAIEPSAQQHTKQLQAFLDKWGMRVGKGVIFDQLHVGNIPLWVRIKAFGPHEINHEFQSPDAFVDVMSSTTIRPSAPGGSDLEVQSLMRTSTNSWEDVNGDHRRGTDEPGGPLPIACAVQGGKVEKPRRSDQPFPKIVVWGSVQAFTNQWNLAGAGHALWNHQYFLNNWRWLLELEQVVAPTSKRRINMLAVDLGESGRTQIATVSMVILPSLGIILGIIAWWSRRK